jgi:hypothetical protein
VFSVLRFTDSDYPIRIFKLFIEGRLFPDSTVALKKKQQHHFVGTFPKAITKTIESGQMNIPKNNMCIQLRQRAK